MNLSFEQAKKLARENIALRKQMKIIDTMESWEEFFAHPKAPGWCQSYALHLIKGRWPEAEHIIMKNARDAFFYAQEVIKGRWPEAEECIKQDEDWAYEYAISILKLANPEEWSKS